MNDALMAVFFLLVGLEIKREFLIGERSSRRSAALPIAAAMGGMLVPVAIYAAPNRGGAGAAGWGVPLATDIAFANAGMLAIAKTGVLAAPASAGLVGYFLLRALRTEA